MVDAFMRSNAPTLKVTGGTSPSIRPISVISQRVHVAYRAVSDAATYSASFELKATQVCFLDFHEIGPSARVKIYPETDRRCLYRRLEVIVAGQLWISPCILFLCR